MVNDNISPEERLFKIIQAEKESPLSGANPEKKNAIINWWREIKGSSFLSGLRWKKPAGEKEEFPEAAPTPIVLLKKLHEIQPQSVNIILVIILGGLIITDIHYAVNRHPDIAKIINTVSRIQVSAVKSGQPREDFKPLNFYIQEVRKRDIFSPSFPSVEAPSAPKQVSAEKLKTMAADLKLRGIAWGASPKAMIQSEKENKMYFLTQGDTIGSTGITIKQILKNKVTISYEDTEMELL